MELGKRKRFLVTRYSTSVSGYLCRGRVAFQSYKMLILLAFIASGFYLFRGSIESFFLLASKTSPAWLMTRLGQFLFLRDRISLIYRLGQFFFSFFGFIVRRWQVVSKFSKVERVQREEEYKILKDHKNVKKERHRESLNTI